MGEVLFGTTPLASFLRVWSRCWRRVVCRVDAARLLRHRISSPGRCGGATVILPGHTRAGPRAPTPDRIRVHSVGPMVNPGRRLVRTESVDIRRPVLELLRDDTLLAGRPPGSRRSHWCSCASSNGRCWGVALTAREITDVGHIPVGTPDIPHSRRHGPAARHPASRR